ncbi:H-2 class II histocompatibility antigen, A-F beta chain-like [Sinocyclocheilus rhinocerous]|uniref:H-2 class II histocompatibility antigen, A-F beta chain-like n=1 Tax=Sinocyclocheilus rhinocerous TaxID=307959 RepID=UPI0007B92F5F|nr:PREDICTED: H-2 class II histocompatibility antigen, A-F beta chain-like [Sinocyclocheilus rhinocerous]
MQVFLFVMAFFNTILAAEEHAYQQFIGCAFNNEGQVSRFWRYGYDGRDIMHVDLVKEAVVATSESGQLLAEERKSKEYIKRKEARLVKVCSAVKTVFLKSNNSLSRAAKPALYVSSGGEKDQEYIKCVVRGFYPNIIKVRWTQKARPIYFGVSTTGILPHKDGTFQMTSYLSLSNVSGHDVTCEIEHLSIDGKMRITYGEKSLFLSQITEHVLTAMIAFLLGFVLPACLTVLFIFIWQKTSKPPEDEIKDTSNESEASLSLNLMNTSQET